MWDTTRPRIGLRGTVLPERRIWAYRSPRGESGEEICTPRVVGKYMNRRKFMVGAGSIGASTLIGGALGHVANEQGMTATEALKRGPSGLTRIETEITNPVDREAYVEVRFAVYDEEGELLNDRFSGYTLDAGETREVSVVVPAERDEADSYSVRIREVE